jgi:hypothetical protein
MKFAVDRICRWNINDIEEVQCANFCIKPEDFHFGLTKIMVFHYQGSILVTISQDAFAIRLAMVK